MGVRKDASLMGSLSIFLSSRKDAKRQERKGEGKETFIFRAVEKVTLIDFLLS